MKRYKVTWDIKVASMLNTGLFFLSALTENDAIFAGSVVTAVIIAATIKILSAIHDIKVK